MLNSIGNYYTSYPFYNGLNSKRYDVVFQENYDAYMKQYALTSNPVGGGGRGVTPAKAKTDEFVKPKKGLNSDKKDITEENKNGEKGLSTTVKVLIGLAAVVGAVALLRKGKVSQAKSLAKNIEFKPAKTIEEAIQFGKTNLGVKKYQGFEAKDVEVVNWANEAFVNVTNKLGGKVTMPKYLNYGTFEGGYAATTTDGGLMLNKNFFANIDKEIVGRLSVLEKQGVLIKNPKGYYEVSGFIDETYAKKLLQQIEKYNKGDFSTFKDKMYLYNYFDDALQVGSVPFNSPLHSIKAILNNDAAVAILNSKGILTDIAQIEKLSGKEQSNLFIKMITDGKLPVAFGEGAGKNVSPFHSIYHELGHLNDSIVSGGWLNQTNIQVAGLVSMYAQNAPREFVAETYAKLIAGKKLPEEVIALYKKLGGPLVAGY